MIIKKIISVLSFDRKLLDQIKAIIQQQSPQNTDDKIFFYTVSESQGAEFESVYFVGVDHKQILEHQSQSANYPQTLVKEKNKVIRDLIYVALTRAMSSLKVYTSDLASKEILKKLGL